MAVAAEAGVPGMFSRMADWQPPEMAPMYTPTRISTASGPSMLYVRPVSSATAMVAVRPGSMPNTRPRPTDRISAIRPIGEKTTPSASRKYCPIMSLPPYGIGTENAT